MTGFFRTSYLSTLGLAPVPATLGADERIGPLAERLVADNTGPCRQRVLSAVLGPSPLVVFVDVFGVRFPPLASADGVTTPAPAIRSRCGTPLSARTVRAGAIAGRRYTTCQNQSSSRGPRLSSASIFRVTRAGSAGLRFRHDPSPRGGKICA